MSQMLIDDMSQMLIDDDKYEWQLRLVGLEFGQFHQKGSLGAIRATIWRLSYWTIIIPFTLTSACLLLSRSRPANQKGTR